MIPKPRAADTLSVLPETDNGGVPMRHGKAYCHRHVQRERENVVASGINTCFRKRFGRRGWGVVGLAACLVIAGCTASGDFGRKQPSAFHDTVLPLIAAGPALNRDEKLSFLPFTANENRLRATSYTLIVAGDILGHNQSVKPYLRYRNVIRPWPHTTPVSAYHDRIVRIRFADSETRFNKVLADMRRDNDALKPFEASANAVRHDDRLRRALMDAEPDLSSRQIERAEARIVDNERLIGLACATMMHRLEVYRYALKHLAIETPTRRFAELETEYRALEDAVEGLNVRFSREVGVAQRMRDGEPLILDPDTDGPGKAGQDSVSQAYSLARPR